MSSVTVRAEDSKVHDRVVAVIIVAVMHLQDAGAILVAALFTECEAVLDQLTVVRSPCAVVAGNHRLEADSLPLCLGLAATRTKHIGLRATCAGFRQTFVVQTMQGTS